MNQKITAKIKKLRMEKSFSQNYMAEQLNITRTAYHNLESGKSYSWAKYLNELMCVFETTPKDFFSDIGNKVVNQNNYSGAAAYVETLHQENKEVYDKLIAAKDEQIALLKSVLDTKTL
ncbi:MAG: helix-turn-helix domain-containing protein [Prevotellaceae bacterium]|jgi:transcriptional regulator with XRE-family HTH domain|nr:helix-turn-helix domain-containing protein [Prevotellaceae bacterium]